MERWIAANPSMGKVLQAMRLDGAFEAGLIGSGAPQELIAQVTGSAAHNSVQNGWYDTRRETRTTGFVHRWPTRGMSRTRRIAFGGVAVGAVLATWIGISHLRSNGATDVMPAATSRFVARAGERNSITLNDGTRILLNAGSTLRVPQDLQTSRTVELAGEAIFTVARRDAIPFLVRTGNARVTVLGTRFVVRRYPEDHKTIVAVADGRVSLRASVADARGEAVIGMRTLGEVTDSGKIVVTPDVDSDRYTQWVAGRLVFENTPLRAVVPELERRYGITIRLTDSALANRVFTSVVTDATPEPVINAIALVFGVKYVRDGSTFTFLPARVHAAPTRRAPLLPSKETMYGK